jgi:hypothetical protein
LSTIALDPVIAEAKRRARRRYLVLAVIVAAAGAVTATLALKETAELRPIVAVPPRCLPAQLRSNKPRFDGAGTGHVVFTFTLTNVSSAGCSLQGWPALEVVLPDGRLVAATNVGHLFNGWPGAARRTRARAVALGPGGVASFHMVADDGTGLESCPIPLPEVTAFVVLPGEMARVRGATKLPYCLDPRRPLVALSPIVAGEHAP